MLQFGVTMAKSVTPSVYIILDGYSGAMIEDRWHALSTACATDDEIDACVRDHRMRLDEVGRKAKQQLRKAAEEATRKPLFPKGK